MLSGLYRFPHNDWVQIKWWFLIQCVYIQVVIDIYLYPIGIKYPLNNNNDIIQTPGSVCDDKGDTCDNLVVLTI